MIKVELEWVAWQVQGELTGDNLEVSSVTIDSRNIKQGDLFIAIRGHNFDGHDYIEQAVRDGASAIICSQSVRCDVPVIQVTDTRHALGLLGKAIKARLNPTTVAMTGSSGKTTVREMTAAILRQRGKVLATRGNFNNDIGVPLTLLELDETHQYAVIELGANHRGEIAYTTGLVQPQVALINNVSPAHVEGFGDIWGVCRAKSEIAKGLDANGVIITNADSDFCDYWQREYANRNHKKFSMKSADADVWASDITINKDGCPSFTLHADGESQTVFVPLPGRHNVANALAAASLCLDLNVSLPEIASGITKLNAVPGRMVVHEPCAGFRLIDDTYNANVASAKAALDVLASFPGYRVMVLGDMGELGAQARAYHEEVGAYAIGAGIDNLFTLGVLSQSASQVFNGHGGQHFDNRDALTDALRSIIEQQSDVTILVKGSRSARMELVVEALAEQHDEANQGGRAAC